MLFAIFVLCYFSISWTTGSAILSTMPKQNEKNQHLQECLNNITSNYINNNDLIVVLSSGKTFEHIQISSKAVVIHSDYTVSFPQFYYKKVDVYVIMVDENELLVLFKFLQQTANWNPRAKFVLVFEELYLRDLFKIVLKRFVFNVVVLVQEFELDFAVFTYFPYSRGNKLTPRLLSICSKGRFNNQANLFPDKLPKKWTDTVLKAALIEYPPYASSNISGIELSLLQLVQSILKFDVQYLNKRYAKWGKRQADGTYTEVYGDVRSSRADVGIGFFQLTYPENIYFDLSFPYLEDYFKWIVPAPKRRSHFQNILATFTTIIWILLLVLLVLVPLVFYFTAKSVEKSKYFHTFSICLIVCFKSIMCQPTHPDPISTTFRFTLAVWCIFCLIIITAFQSNLVTYLNFDQLEDPIDSLQELIKSGLKFGFHEELSILYFNSNHKEEQYIYDHFENCDIGYGCLNRTAFSKDFATIKPQRFASFYMGTDATDFIHFFGQTVQHANINMVFAKGHPVFESVNELLLRMKQVGFVKYYCNTVNHYNKLDVPKKRGSSLNTNKLYLEELEGIFTLLVIGQLTSLVVFLLEFNSQYINDTWHCIKCKLTGNK